MGEKETWREWAIVRGGDRGRGIEGYKYIERGREKRGINRERERQV